MNQLGTHGDHDDSKTSRACFIKYFLQVLGEIAHFGPTPEEVKELFMEISAGEPRVPYSSLYESQLSLFLSDLQINQMITLFRNIPGKDQRLSLGGRSRRSSLFVKSDSSKLRNESPDLHSMENAEVGPARLSETHMMEKVEGNPKRSTINEMKSSHSRFSTRRRSSILENSKRDFLYFDDFMEHYASFLAQITEASRTIENTSAVSHGNVTDRGVDLAKKDLSLKVQVRGCEVNVVNNVSGRLQAATMTALMGGSGAGKTSLLNALSGRAFYGTTTGTVLINGNVALIEEHEDALGFVPQSDDSIFAETTVKENLMYSGRFFMPKGTPLEEIEEHADDVLASLGLSRVANSIVGDVNLRGVSGGEEKRVNIGMELMSKPSILFLDEPTSGLDSSSALLVMRSLKNLVKTSRMTICSVIHQPRMQIFDCFDSLLLLGAGGNMVYHGPIRDVQSYFEKLKAPYLLPPGESVADWLIDISSGRLAPIDTSDFQSFPREDDEDIEGDSVTGDLTESSAAGPEFEKSIGESSSSNLDENEENNRTSGGVSIFRRGESASALQTVMESEEDRRQVLYDYWETHFKNLSENDKARYIAPHQYDLPRRVEKPSFFRQLKTHVGRNLLLMWRNRSSKLIDTIVIVGGVALVSLVDGVLEITVDWTPNLSFDQLVDGDPLTIPDSFPELFMHAIKATYPMNEYGLKVAMLIGLPLGLSAAKMISIRRLQFFRESGSGLGTLGVLFFCPLFTGVVLTRW